MALNLKKFISRTDNDDTNTEVKINCHLQKNIKHIMIIKLYLLGYLLYCIGRVRNRFL